MVASPKEGQKPRRAGYLKMKVIDNLKKETINEQVRKLASNVSEIDTDDSTSYVELKDFVPKHNAQVIQKDKVGEALPWVHIAISNAKKVLLNTYHDVKPPYIYSFPMSQAIKEGRLMEYCYFPKMVLLCKVQRKTQQYFYPKARPIFLL
jgi:hypothetical protein